MLQENEIISSSAPPPPPGAGRSPASSAFNTWGEGAEVSVIKIGGNIIDNEAALQHFLSLFAAAPGYKVLVHGGGKLATRLAEQLQVAQQLVNGRRVTDAATLQVVTMVYAGDINKRVVAGLQALGVNALGLTGADGNLVTAKKRTGTGTDYGFVGDVTENGVNGILLQQLLAAGITPVVAPITHDGAGQLLNTNADTMANEIAVALAGHAAVNLVFCFEKSGVLMNPDDETSVIPVIQPQGFAQLKEAGVVTAGMIPKVENALQAVQRGVKQVLIGKAEQLPQLLSGTAGTVFKL